MTYLIALFALILSTPQSLAQEEPAAPEAKAAYKASGLPLPRFVSIGTREVYMRAGPDTRFPIAWVYTKKGLPLEVVAEFEHWRRVKDPSGEEGWMHRSMLTGSRTAISQGETQLRRGSNGLADVIAEIEPGVVMDVVRCPNASAYCRVEVAGLEGWMDRSLLWGVYADEVID